MNGNGTEKKIGLFHNIAYSGIGSAIYTFCQWLITIIIIRMCGYTESGYYALAITITNTFYAISLWGVRSFQIADIDNKYKFNDYFYNRVLTNVIAIVAFTIFMIYNQYSIEQSLVIIIYMAYKIVDSFFDLFDAVCQKDMRMDIVSKSMIFRSILSIIIFMLFSYVTKSVLISISAMTIISLVFILFYNYKFCMRQYNLMFKVTKSNVIAITKICLPLMLSGFLLSFNLMIPKYLYEKSYRIELLGIYTTVTSLALVVQLAAQTILAPMLPVLAEHYKQKKYKEFKSILLKFFLLCASVLVLAFVSVYFLGAYAIGLIYGPDIAIYTDLLYLAILSSFFTIILWIISYILTLLRKTKIQLAITAFGTLICILTSYYFLETFDLNGISISIIISQVVQLVVMVILIQHIIRGKKQV